MFAYWIKPHLMIALIAIIIVEISCFKKQISKREIGIIIKRIAATIAGVAVSACIYNFAIVPSLHLQLNPEKTLGFQHYLMMGLNESSDGVYWEDDVSFTKSFATNAERNQADMEKAKERIKKFGIQGLIHHLSRKQLVNYGDGTFAWAVEGHSFNGDPDWAKNKLSAEIDSYIRPEGSHYNFQS